MRLRVLAAMALAVIVAASAATLAQQRPGLEPIPDPGSPAPGKASEVKGAFPAAPAVEAPALGIPEPSPNPAPPAAAAAPATDDPMEAVEAFVTRNRQEAAGAIESLTKEAEALRARLQKVEAALVRWQAVSRALEQPDQPPAGPAEAAKAEPPPEVGPVEPLQGPEPAPLPERPREVPKAAG